jgi:acetyl esterase/lipase
MILLVALLASQDPITVTRDISYAGTENPRQRLDLYLPKERPSGRLPVVVFLHGGGRKGNKAEGAEQMKPLLRTGRYAGVSVGYRPSGEAKWPASLHDCKAAIRWIRANADKYDFDPDRIGVWGRDSGADLALLLGVSGDVPELEGDLGPHRGTGSRVACVVNFFGASDLSTLLTWISRDDAPVLTVHGTADRTVPYDQAVRLDEALGRAGVPSFFITVKGGGHGDFGLAAQDRVEEFFAKYLLGSGDAMSTEPIDFETR